MNLKYRQAKQRDLSALITLLSADALGSTREDASLPLNKAYLRAFDSIEADNNNELIVVEKDAILVGMIQLTFIPYLSHTGSWRCLIEGVRVARDYRNNGIGTELIKWAIERARERRCTIVQLTSDKQRNDAIRFYQELGFAASHEGFKLKL